MIAAWTVLRYFLLVIKEVRGDKRSQTFHRVLAIRRRGDDVVVWDLMPCD